MPRSHSLQPLLLAFKLNLRRRYSLRFRYETNAYTENIDTDDCGDTNPLLALCCRQSL